MNLIEKLEELQDAVAKRLFDSSDEVQLDDAIKKTNIAKFRRTMQKGTIQRGASDFIALNLRLCKEASPEHRGLLLDEILAARPKYSLPDKAFESGDSLLLAIQANEPEHTKKIADQLKKEKIRPPGIEKTLMDYAKKALRENNTEMVKAITESGLLIKHFEKSPPPLPNTPKETPSNTPAVLPAKITPHEFGLTVNGVKYIANGIFQGKGMPKKDQGWKIHLSATPENCTKILTVALKFLQEKNIPHKFIAPEDFIKRRPQDNTYDKLITIYPDSMQEAAQLLHTLDQALTKANLTEARWKDQPENRWGKSGVLSYRYGGFTKTTITLPTGEEILDDRKNPNQVPDSLRSLLQTYKPPKKSGPDLEFPT